MKLFITFSTLFVSSLALGQNNPFWNPDANGDDLIGFADLASLLSVYNTSLTLDDTLSCNYDGGTFGEFWYDVFTESIVIDSIHVQWEYEGVQLIYEPFCPDPIEDPFAFSVGQTLQFNYYSFEENWIGLNTYYAQIEFSSGDMSFEVFNYSFGQPYFTFGSYVYYGAAAGYSGVSSPSWGAENNYDAPSWVFDEQGMYSTSYNSSENQFFRLIPYWHYAE